MLSRDDDEAPTRQKETARSLFVRRPSENTMRPSGSRPRNQMNLGPLVNRRPSTPAEPQGRPARERCSSWGLPFSKAMDLEENRPFSKRTSATSTALRRGAAAACPADRHVLSQLIQVSLSTASTFVLRHFSAPRFCASRALDLEVRAVSSR